MKKFFCLLILFGCVASGVRAGSGPLNDAYIRYHQTSWQVYEFFVVTGQTDAANLKYNWNVDGRENFYTPTLRYFFPRGDHAVSLRVEDALGNVKIDKVRLAITFWSLENNWFLWLVYLLLALLIIYYWIVKMVYLFNKKRVGRKARRFLQFLDDESWVERLVAQHLRGRKKKLESGN